MLLAYILNMERYWGWDSGNDPKLGEKEAKTSRLNRNILFYIIRNNLHHMFGEPKVPQTDPFWRAFCDLVHFFFVGIRTIDMADYDATLDHLIDTIAAHA